MVQVRLESCIVEKANYFVYFLFIVPEEIHHVAYIHTYGIKP